MTRSDALRIADIVAACLELSPIQHRGYEVFSDDPILQRAAERLLEIIGEAANQLSDQCRNEYPNTPWVDIRRFRIFVAHEYFRVEPMQIWKSLEIHVPILLAELVAKTETND